MCDQQHREFLASSPGCITSAQRRTAVGARLQYEQPGEEREEMGRQNLHDLPIKNQELRMSLLDAATNHQSGEANQ
jgi:hypothetical protein